jgi:hypothetical protein
MNIMVVINFDNASGACCRLGKKSADAGLFAAANPVMTGGGYA